MTVFGRRRIVPPSLPVAGVSVSRPSRWIRVLVRIWAVFVFVVAVGGLLQGAWIGSLALLAHAVLVWPEVGDFAARLGVAWVRLVCAGVTLVVFIVLVSLGAGDDEIAVEPEMSRSDVMSKLSPPPSTLGAYRSKIPGHAFSRIDRSDYYISVHRRLGPTRVRDANTLAPWVALRVSFASSCDRVDMVEISQDASQAELRWFVDCLNRQRFYVNEADAKATRVKFADVPDTAVIDLLPEDLPRAENAKVIGFDELAGLRICEASLRSRLQQPDAYRPVGAARTQCHPQRGRVTITRSFITSNGLGQSIHSQWECLLDAGDTRVIEIKWLDAGQWRVAAKGSLHHGGAWN